MTNFRRAGSRAREVSASVRASVPQVREAEAALGARLVVAKNVMRLRIQRGYTQAQLADELGVTQSRIAQIEAARTNLQLDTLERLARVLGVEMATLVKSERPASAERLNSGAGAA